MKYLLLICVSQRHLLYLVKLGANLARIRILPITGTLTVPLILTEDETH